MSPAPPDMSNAASTSVLPIFAESAWLTCVSLLAGLTAESRENTLIPAVLALVRTGCRASKSLPTMQIAATFCEMSDSMIWICASAVGCAGACRIALNPCSSMPALNPLICLSP